ncbi:hypothetical protein [Virgibacillus indicus]|uniref:hypothetical protein n=1 Tax=Virgibacillus indicus TaxID=2024554 RepID=UPI0013FD281C|nr:hypothetical protein [Virgibacillus indicus]
MSQFIDYVAKITYLIREMSIAKFQIFSMGRVPFYETTIIETGIALLQQFLFWLPLKK